MRFEDVPQGPIVVGNDGIEEVKENVFLGRMVNICRDLDEKILR